MFHSSDLFRPFGRFPDFCLHPHRTDPEVRQYTGALVGLGYDPRTNLPILPDHDIEVVFDVAIDWKDLVSVSRN